MKIFKIRTLLVAAVAGGTGYVLGTKAGQSRYVELKVQADKLRAQADRLARSPQVRETVANVADKVKETAEKLPDPVAEVVNKAADAATEATAEASTGGDDSIPAPTTLAPATAAPDLDALEGDDPPRPVV